MQIKAAGNKAVRHIPVCIRNRPSGILSIISHIVDVCNDLMEQITMSWNCCSTLPCIQMHMGHQRICHAIMQRWRNDILS